MKLWTLTGTAAALLTLPALSQAEFNYTTAEFNYLLDVELDGAPGSVDGDGFSFVGTYEIAESFFISGRYDDYDFDFGNASISGDLIEVGGGYFHSLNEDLDFVATLNFLDFEVGGGDDDGLGIGGGVRARLSDAIEVDAMIEYVNMDEGDSDTGLELRGRYYLSPEFAVQAKIGLGSDVEILAIGVRGEFGGGTGE